MAELVAGYPQVLPTRIPMSTICSSSTHQGNNIQNGCGNGYGPGKSSASPYVVNDKLTDDSRRVTPNCNGKVIGNTRNNEGSSRSNATKSLFKRIMFGKSSKEKKRDRKTPAENCNVKVRSKGHREVVSGDGTIDNTIGTVDKTGFRRQTNISYCGMESGRTLGLSRSASMNHCGGKDSFLRERSVLRRSASFSTGPKTNTGEKKPYKPEHGSIGELAVDDGQVSPDAGYSPVWASRHNIAKSNKTSFQRLPNEQIQLNEMTKSSSSTTLDSLTMHTKPKETIWLSRDQSNYSPSSQVFEKRQLKEDTSLGAAVKLAARTKAKKKSKIPGDAREKPTKKGKNTHQQKVADDTRRNINSYVADNKIATVETFQEGHRSVKPAGKPSSSGVRNSVHYYSPSDITNTINSGRPKSMVYASEHMKTQVQRNIIETGSERSVNSQVPTVKPSWPSAETRNLKLSSESPVISKTGEHSRRFRSALGQKHASSDTPTRKSVNNISGSSATTPVRAPEENNPRNVTRSIMESDMEHSRTLRSTMEKRRQTSNPGIQQGSSVTAGNSPASSKQPVGSCARKDTNGKSLMKGKHGNAAKSRIQASPSKSSQSNDVICDYGKLMADHKFIITPDNNANPAYETMPLNTQNSRSPYRQSTSVEKRECENETKDEVVRKVNTPQRPGSLTQEDNGGLNSQGQTDETGKRPSNMNSPQRPNVAQKPTVRHVGFGKFDKSKPRPKSEIYQRQESHNEFSRDSYVRRSFAGVIKQREVRPGRSTVEFEKERSLQARPELAMSEMEREGGQCTSPHSKLPRPVVSPRKEGESHQYMTAAEQRVPRENVSRSPRRSESLGKYDGKLRRPEVRNKHSKQEMENVNRPLRAEINANTKSKTGKECPYEKSVRNQVDTVSRNITVGCGSDSGDTKRTDPGSAVQACKASNSGTVHQRKTSGTEAVLSEGGTDIASSKSAGHHQTQRSIKDAGQIDPNVTKAGISSSVTASVGGKMTTAGQCSESDDVIRYANRSNNQTSQRQDQIIDKDLTVAESHSHTQLHSVKTHANVEEPTPVKLCKDTQESNDTQANDGSDDLKSHEWVLTNASVGRETDYLEPLKHAKSISLNDLLDGSRSQSDTDSTGDLCCDFESRDNASTSSRGMESAEEVSGVTACHRENSVLPDNVPGGDETGNQERLPGSEQVMNSTSGVSTGNLSAHSKITTRHAVRAGISKSGVSITETENVKTYPEDKTESPLATQRSKIPVHVSQPANQTASSFHRCHERSTTNPDVCIDQSDTNYQHRHGSSATDKQLKGVALSEVEVKSSSGTLRVVESISPSFTSTPTHKRPKGRETGSPHSGIGEIRSKEQYPSPNESKVLLQFGRSPQKKSGLPRPTSGSLYSSRDIPTSVGEKSTQMNDDGRTETDQLYRQATEISADENDVLHLTEDRQEGDGPRKTVSASVGQNEMVSEGDDQKWSVGKELVLTPVSNRKQDICKYRQETKDDAFLEKTADGISQSATTESLVHSSAVSASQELTGAASGRSKLSASQSSSRLKRSRALSCLLRDRFHSDMAWSEVRKLDQSEESLDALLENESPSEEVMGETDNDDVFTVTKRGEREEAGRSSERGHSVRFASTPVVRTYDYEDRPWPGDDVMATSREDEDVDSFVEVMDSSGENEGRYMPASLELPDQQQQGESEATGNETQESEEVCHDSGDDENTDWMVVAASLDEEEDDRTGRLVCGTPYVLHHMERETSARRHIDEERAAAKDMLKPDNRHCEEPGNNGAIQSLNSGVTSTADKRAGRDGGPATKPCWDADRTPRRTESAMCRESSSQQGYESRSNINNSDVTRPPSFTENCAASPCQARTWTNIDFAIKHNGEEIDKGVWTTGATSPGVTNRDVVQVKDCEQSGGLLKGGNAGLIVSRSGQLVEKPDLTISESGSAPEPDPSHSVGGTSVQQTRPLHVSKSDCCLLSSSSLLPQNVATDTARTAKDRTPKRDESLSSRLRKKSMLIAYDEGQLEIADDTTYRSLDIEADFDLIAQLNELDGEYNLEVSSLKSPYEDNNNMSKGTPSPSSKSDKEKKHSPFERGSAKRNSFSALMGRRNSGVSNISLSSLDLEGKEQKSPIEKLQKLKKQISESILGSTKHKKKVSSEVGLTADQTVFPGEATSPRECPGHHKVHRKDSGADLSARADDSERTQHTTPNFERRPSLRRQRKLAMSPVENERILAQWKKERANSWSGSDDSGINNNQSRSSTDVSITEDDPTKESSATPGETEVVRRRTPRHLQRRPKSDIGDHRWEDYGAVGGPPAPPPRTVTRRPISDPLMRDDNELGEVVYRERRITKPRPKSDHLRERVIITEECPKSPATTRYRPGSLAVIRDYGGEETSSLSSTSLASEKSLVQEAKSEKLPAGSKLRRSRRPRPVSDLGHINMKDIETYVQQRRYSGVGTSKVQGEQTPGRLPSTPDSIHRSISTPSGLHEMDVRILSPDARLQDEDSSSGEDINSPAYQSLSTQQSMYSQNYSQNDYSTDDYTDVLTYAEALWDHVTMDEDELAFKAGDVIEVTDMLDKDWWWGRIEDKQGWFPAVFVRLRVNQGETVEECVAKIKDGTLSLSSKHMKKLSISFLSKDQVRANVIHEIVSTEKIYVKHLRDVCEGYVRQCRKRPEMFSSEITDRLFGNLEEIYSFQSKFVKKLQACLNEDIPHLSEIGNCFLENRHGFEIYAPYCNNHPSAMSTLKELYENRKYRHFFEACRLLQEMIEISLDGFLLTPVQKICKYPLQLAELLKYTKPEHKDYEPVKAALQVMKDVAAKINEQKRRLESVHTIAKWQLTIEAWEDEDLLERSSMLIHSGEVTKISKGLGRAKVRQVFLFDHQLVLCKRDLLNKNKFSYAGRVYIDQIILEDMDDGKDNAWGINVKNAFQLHNTVDEKWHIISVKTKEDKERWIKAFAEERKLVRDDRLKNFVIPDHVKREAVIEAMKEQHQQQLVKKPKNVNRKISHMPFPRQLELLSGPQKSVTLPQGISSEEAFLAMGDQEHYKKRTWNLFGTIKRRR